MNLLVLRCRDIEATRAFYETLGICFTQEKHGTGKNHRVEKDPDGRSVEIQSS